jgi:hypothetical protein
VDHGWTVQSGNDSDTKFTRSILDRAWRQLPPEVQQALQGRLVVLSVGRECGAWVHDTNTTGSAAPTGREPAAVLPPGSNGKTALVVLSLSGPESRLCWRVLHEASHVFPGNLHTGVGHDEAESQSDRDADEWWRQW